MTSDINAYHQAVVAIVCLTWAAALMYRFRLYLRPRNKGESWLTFIQRARNDRTAYLKAKATLHGTRATTVVIGLFNIAMLLGLMWVILHFELLRWIALAYVAIGAYLTPRLLKTPAGYEQVTVFDRVTWRFDYSWFWPFLLTRNLRK